MSELSVYRITLTSRNPRTGEPYFINLECSSPTIDDLAELLNDGRLVRGSALTTRKSDEPNTFEVVGRRTMYLSRQGVAHIEPPTFGFVEYEASHD